MDEMEELSLAEVEEALEHDYYEHFELNKPKDNIILDDPQDFLAGKASYSVTGYEKRINRQKNTWAFVITDWH